MESPIDPNVCIYYMCTGQGLYDYYMMCWTWNSQHTHFWWQSWQLWRKKKTTFPQKNLHSIKILTTLLHIIIDRLYNIVYQALVWDPTVAQSQLRCCHRFWQDVLSTLIRYSLGQWFPNFLARDPKETLGDPNQWKQQIYKLTTRRFAPRLWACRLAIFTTF